nr:DUF5615 family PIN-like protein [Micromonospora sp. DSM 115978]
MKLLIDANLSPRIAARLAEAGHEASHVMDHGLLSASDEKIAVFAVAGNYVIVSADSAGDHRSRDDDSPQYQQREGTRLQFGRTTR